MMSRKWLWVLVFMCLTGFIKAQTINSPYSNSGLGEIAFQGLPHNYAMGELGIGSYSSWHINLQNPAMLINNTFSSFQVGITGDFRNYRSNTSDASDNSASLRFLAMSFPVVRNRWVTSLAALPLSSVKYNTFSSDTLSTGSINTTSFQGDGGLSQFLWTNAFRLFKSLSIGIKASYIFGSIDKSSRLQLSGEDVVSPFIVSHIESLSYNDFNFSTGVAYKIQLSEKNWINLGATYNISSTLEGTRDEFYQRQRLTGTTIQTQLISEGQSIKFGLPTSYGLGASFERVNSFKLGLDLRIQQWSESTPEDNLTSFRNITNLSVGGEWIPDIQNVSSYFKRTTYRFGITNRQLPYLLNDTKINDFGINFGASFPVSGLSSMDLAFKYGIRGTLSNDLIRENYLQVTIGATINDRWFIKRRYD